jgi:hypothetical protein
MAQPMDAHTNMVGVTPESLAVAHRADLALLNEESVDFRHKITVTA